MHSWLHPLCLSALIGCGASSPAPPNAPQPDAPEPTPEPVPDLDTMSEDEQLAYLMEKGADVYKTGGSSGIACSTCHQSNGEGLPPSFPPLAGSRDAMGDCQTHASYVIHGLSGEIVVQGVTYNGVMPAQRNITDLELAAVLTYERQSWGNHYGKCLPEEVAKAR